MASSARLVWLGAAGLALLLPGCAETDPYARAGMWQPTGANSRNLAAMVANPSDLIRGRGERGFYGTQATTPVTQLWAGKPAPLPSGSSQSTTPGPASPAAGGS